MMRSRIREIRKEKGLTLQEVAARLGTTAQTIGRLETGRRTLSIKWVRRIAEALGTDPAELLALSGGADLDVSGVIQGNGRVSDKSGASLALRFSAETHCALKMAESVGSYTKGDVVVFEQLGEDKWSTAIGNDCLVRGSDGNQYLGRLAGLKGKTAELLGLGPGMPQVSVKGVDYIGRATTMVRRLAT